MLTEQTGRANEILSTPAKDSLQQASAGTNGERQEEQHNYIVDQCAAESNMLINTDSSHNKVLHDNIAFSASPEVE